MNDAAQLLDRALAQESYSPEAILLTGAAVSLITGEPLVIVGGAAVNCHIGTYVPTDIDLVGPIGPDQLSRLERYGFERRGRHFVLERSGGRLDVEVPSGTMVGDEDPEDVEVAPGLIARLISVNDLMMDRLRQATEGSVVTLQEALRLAVGAYPRIDWDAIHRRAAQENMSGLPQLVETLASVQKKAKRLLRAAEHDEGDE